MTTAAVQERRSDQMAKEDRRRDSRTTKTVSLYKKGSQMIVDWGDSAYRTITGPWAKDYFLLSEFKWQLDETLNLPPLENNITPLKATTDYLRKLHENIVEELKDLPFYTSTHFQYWLTVPAHWSGRAKDTMRQAAIEAGFVKASDPPHRLMMISEDEATAFFCAGSTAEVQFKAKDRLMIYSAMEGKGFHLVVLEVSESSAVQSRRWKDVARRHGTDCISTSLDAKMRRFLEDKLWKYIDKVGPKGMGELMDAFRDSVKRSFVGIENQYLQVPIGLGLNNNDSDAGLEGGYLVLSALELKVKVFEPVAANVLKLIRTVLQEQQRLYGECKAIFMFVEWGMSQYLLERVRQEFRNQVGLVIVPTGQDAAIASGAVYAGLASYRTGAHSFHSPTPRTTETLLNAPRLSSASLSSAKPHSPTANSPSPGNILSTQPFNVGNNPYQDQRQNNTFHQQYQQQDVVQQQVYHSQTLQQQQQQQQQKSDSNRNSSFNMGHMASELPLPYVPQATVSSGMATFGQDGNLSFDMGTMGLDMPLRYVPQAAVSSGMATFGQGRIQGSGYDSGPAFNPGFINGGGGGSVYG
ncbi:hypothetical protein BGZ95_005565, partial [Linnemannia exigua]